MLDKSRDLVVFQMSHRILFDGIIVQRRQLPDHKSFDDFTQNIVPYPNARGFRYAVHHIQDFFNLNRANLFSAHIDYFFYPAFQVYVAVGIHIPPITGTEIISVKISSELFFTLPPIRRAYMISGDTKLAVLTGSGFFAFIVKYRQATAWRRFPHRQKMIGGIMK